MNYGLPYMGSKNKIAKWIVDILPSAHNFYDLFCGGCAITHYAMLDNKYDVYLANDIKGELPKAFIDGINGKFSNEDRWISHDEFFDMRMNNDSYVNSCFSFGNNWCGTYAYSKKIEPLKKAAHYAIFFKDYSLMDKLGIDVRGIDRIETKRDRYLAFKKIVKESFGRFDLQRLESLERLERLQSLESLLRLQSLESLKDYELSHILTRCNESYDFVHINPNSVIYCDIPYKGKREYSKDAFDYEKFYKWALKQTEPVFISEYWMPDDFVCIAEKERISPLSATNNSLKNVEKIFVPKHQIK